MVNIYINKVASKLFKSKKDEGITLDEAIRRNEELLITIDDLEKQVDELEAKLKVAEVYVPTVEHEYKLRLNTQGQSSNMRYYFRSVYLLSAPAKYEEKIQHQFNKLMGFGLSAKEVKEELRNYTKDLVENGVNPVRLDDL